MDYYIIAQVGDTELYLNAHGNFSLMQILKNPINNEKIIQYRDNILATCGGNMSCSSCVVKIHDDWVDKLMVMGEEEMMFIDIFLDQYGINDDINKYRLSCQIIFNDALNGLKILLI